MMKEWHKPKLIVLSRGKPEEYVLGGCKGMNLSGPGGDNCIGLPGSPEPTCFTIRDS